MVAPSREQPVTIVLADDHVVVRSALRMLLEAEPGFEVVAEAGDADSAARYVLGHKPTVLVLDLNMPGGSGLEAIPQIRERSPNTQIVVLTMQKEAAFAREAMRAGALGYILKDAADEELVRAVRMAAEGQTYLQPELGARMAAEPVDERDHGLSEREVEVLRLLATELSGPEIAGQLFVSLNTLRTHTKHIFTKLDVNTRRAAVRRAGDLGLL
jgi:two-component system, NarL family, response regulator NreC